MGCCPGSGGVSDTPDEPHTFFFKKRGCTDIFCVGLFAAYWGIMCWIIALSMTAGDPMAVFYGADYLGNRCGQGKMKDKPAVIFPRLGEDLEAQAAIATTTPWKLTFYGLCVKECPDISEPQDCFDDPDTCKVLDYGKPSEWRAAGGSEYYFMTMPSINLINRCIPTESTKLDQDDDRCAFPQCDGSTYGPCDATYPTTWVITPGNEHKCEVIFRVGEVQQLQQPSASPLTDAVGENVATIQRVVESLYDARTEIIIYGLALPAVFGFAWLVLLRLFAGIFTYIMITGIGIGMCFLTLYLFVRAGAVDELIEDLDDSDALNKTLSSASDALVAAAPSELTDAANSSENEVPELWFTLAIITAFLTLFYIISMCMARAKIRVAVALVKEGVHVIKDRPAIMLFPFGPLICQVLVAVFAVLIFLFLGTANLTMEHLGGITDALKSGASYLDKLAWYNETIEDGGAEEIEDLDSSAMGVQVVVYLVFLFGILWTIESIQNIGWTAMSGSVSHWFFFRDNESAKTKTPLLRSLGRVFRYHLGSIFFGSFIIALIQLIRIILMAIDKYTKEQQKANFVLKLAIKCCQCCMWCLEKTVKFITNYCWIYVAMQGSGFCKACFLTFSLIVSNPAQLAINTFVRTILAWIQIIGLPVVCAWLCNATLVASGADEAIYPTVLVAIAAYVIAKIYSMVFAVVLDTLFVCCARDKAEYKGKYMPDRLKKAFGFNKKDAAEEGDAAP